MNVEESCYVHAEGCFFTDEETTEVTACTNPCKNISIAKIREDMYCIFLLEWMDINAIAYYSILRNANAHMHRKCF